jgi:hypothetical protein
VSGSALEAIARVLDRGGEPDDVLRSVVHELAEDPGIAWAGVAFLEDGELTVGPHAGAPDESRRVRVAVTYQGARVGELWVDGEADRELLERVAALVSTHVLVGWDTGGEGWDA